MSQSVSATAKPANPNAPTAEKVLEVEHYTDRLFRFVLTRPQTFRFRSGEFVMIGLPSADPDAKKPIMRAYSIASPAWDETLEFYSIKVPDGPLTSRLQKIQIGDEVLLGKKPVGTLVLDALKPGKRLYMFSTGTGFAPFASVLRDPETYEKFESVVVTHTCRDVAELSYSKNLVASLKDDPLIGDLVGDKVIYFPSTTRQTSAQMGRITQLIERGELFDKLNVTPLDPDADRVMICGSMEMINDTKALCKKAGLEEGSNAKPADFVIEKGFTG